MRDREICLRCYTEDYPGECVDGGRAVETHWRIDLRDGFSQSWAVCGEHVKLSRDLDAEPMTATVYRFLYLPIVQPVMGNDDALAMEAALDAVCRLLRIRDDRSPLARDEAAATLAVLRATQAEAYERVHGRRAA